MTWNERRIEKKKRSHGMRGEEMTLNERRRDWRRRRDHME